MADKSAYNRKQAIKDDQLLTNYADLLNQKLSDQVDNYKEINKLRKGLLDSMVDEKDNLQQQKTLIEEYEEKLSNIADRRTKAYKDLQREVDFLKEAVREEERRVDLTKKLEGKATGLLDKMESQVRGIPIIGDLLAHTMDMDSLKKKIGPVINNFTKSFTQASAAGQGFGGSLKTALGTVSKGLDKATIKQMAFNAKAMMNPYIAIAAAVLALIVVMRKLQQSALAVNQATIDMGREMGIANSQAEEMYSNFNQMSIASNNLNMSTKNLIQAQKELASSIGMTAQYSAGMLQDQIHLTKYMGMSGDQAANFQKIAASSGQSTREMQREVAGTVQALNDATGMSIDFAGVMRDIADLSPEIRSRFRGNTKELALAVAEAKALGTTLEASSNAADKLLNMESSLQAEMKARMLTVRFVEHN